MIRHLHKNTKYQVLAAYPKQIDPGEMKIPWHV